MKSGTAQKKREFTPESGNVDTYECKTGSFVVYNVTHGNIKEDNQLDGTHILFEDTKYTKMFCDTAVSYKCCIRT